MVHFVPYLIYLAKNTILNVLLHDAQRLAVWPVAICGLRHYLPLQTLMRGRTFQITTSPAIGYIACCLLALIHFFNS